MREGKGPGGEGGRVRPGEGMARKQQGVGGGNQRGEKKTSEKEREVQIKRAKELAHRRKKRGGKKGRTLVLRGVWDLSRGMPVRTNLVGERGEGGGGELSGGCEGC